MVDIKNQDVAPQKDEETTAPVEGAEVEEGDEEEVVAPEGEAAPEEEKTEGQM